MRLERLDVRRSRALGALLGLVAHLRALGQRLEAVALDRAVVNEQVLACVIRCDEAVALLVVEPLHGSCSHSVPSGIRALRNAEGAQGNDCDTRGTSFDRASA